ncbi:3981_t:CDS:2, partial [Racocetra fulgida]
NEYSLLWIPFCELRIIEEIGSGKFSTVYSARWQHSDFSLDMVALKFLHGSQENCDGFLKEVCKMWAFEDRKHDYKLALEICDGLRPTPKVKKQVQKDGFAISEISFLKQILKQIANYDDNISIESFENTFANLDRFFDRSSDNMFIIENTNISTESQKQH